jgi:hypothetical protein
MANPANEMPGSVNAFTVTDATKMVRRKRIIALIKNDASPNVIMLKGMERKERIGLRISIIMVSTIPVIM